MKNKLFVILVLCSQFSLYADEEEIKFSATRKGGDRTEVMVDPTATFDDENNSIKMSIDALGYYTLKVIDIYGTTVFSCPVLMVDGTPTNYVLPQLPAGIYTLKVESDDVTYEGTLVIE